MRKMEYYFWLLVTGVLVGAISFPIHAQKRPGGYKLGELICKMQPGYSIDIINNAYGTSTKSQQPQIDCYLLMIPPEQDEDSLATEIGARPEVVYCRPNFYLTAPEPYQRSEPFIDFQYIGDFDSQLAATSLQLSEAHTISTGDGARIAVIDGGANFDHPLFDTMPGNIISRWDYIDGDSIAFDEPGGSCSGHGTFVTGVIKLVAPASWIYVYRVLDTAGQGDGYSIADAVLKAIEDSCRVINLSLGMLGIHDALDDALRFARSRDVMVIAAAGNDSSSSSLLFPFPASRVYCLAVAAVDSVNRKADFSNYGEKVDICAPGTRIYAPYLYTEYAWWDGTSFSTAFASGLAGLLSSMDSTLTWDELDSLILKSADNIDSLNPGLEGMLGWGTINILAALSNVSPSYILGDANNDGGDDLLDVLFLIDHIYNGGPEPAVFAAADVKDDGVLNLLDILYLISHLFKGLPLPE